jgi:nucleoid DNA-binding protein
MNVAVYISELLYSNDCVILPGFGGFVTSYSPAKVHPANHSFYPPSKNILFNSRLTRDDGLLVDYVAGKNKINYAAAKSEIAEYVSQINYKLNQGEKVELTYLGLFFMDREKNLLFDPNTSVNYLEDSFGLADIVMHPIDRKPKLRKKETAFIDRKPESENSTRRKKAIYAALTVVPVILIIGWLVFFGLPKPDKTQQAGITGLSDVDTNVEQPVVVDNEVEKDPPIETLNFTEPIEEENLAEEIIPQNIVSKKYYIIGGSFTNEINADKLVGILRNKGYDAHRAGLSRKGLYVVAYFSTIDKEEALINLALIRKDDNPSAWLLKK